MITKRIQVFGKVQGVFFRASTKAKAEELGLQGWVKNELDGSVLMEVTGDLPSVEKLLDWCHKGPMLANVNRLEATDVAFSAHAGFSITT